MFCFVVVMYMVVRLYKCFRYVILWFTSLFLVWFYVILLFSSNCVLFMTWRTMCLLWLLSLNQSFSFNGTAVAACISDICMSECLYDIDVSIDILTPIFLPRCGCSQRSECQLRSLCCGILYRYNMVLTASSVESLFFYAVDIACIYLYNLSWTCRHDYIRTHTRKTK